MNNKLTQFNFKDEIRHCPKCDNTKFNEHECGADTYDDDVYYISFSCTKCGLWFDGWSGKWFEGVDNWRDTEDKESFENFSEVKN